MYLLQVAVDLLCLSVAYFLGRITRHWWDGRPLDLLVPDPATSLFAISALSCIALLALSQRDYVRRRPFWEELRGIVNAVAIAAAINAVLILVTKQYSPVTQYLAAWTVAPLLIPLGRYVLKKHLLSVGKWQRQTVMVGTGQNALDAYRAFASEPLMGFKIVAFIRPDAANTNNAPDRVLNLDIPVEPESAWNLERLKTYQVVMALDVNQSALQTDYLVRLSRAGHRDVFVAPSLGGLTLHGMEITHFFRHELLLMSVRNNLARKGPRLLKRLFDVIASLLLLSVLWPLLGWITARIWLTGTSAIFAHARVGHGGRTFSCLKFRTMVPDANRILDQLLESDPVARSEWNREFKLKDDPRVTSIGKFLRQTSLDELPQIWNVLKGDMSLVGPRPVMAEELQRYGEDRSYYLQSRPGITGLWQISGRNDVDYGARVTLDVWYVRNWSLWYDLAILMKTVPVVLGRKGAY